MTHGESFASPWRHLQHLALFAVVTLALCACGFEPMLGTRGGAQSSTAEDFARIKVGYIQDRSGQVLRNDLVETLNPGGEPEKPAYTLSIRIEEPQRNLAFERNNSVSFVSYSVIAYWNLLDQKGASVFSTYSSSSLQYAVSNSQYATAINAQDARDRVVLDISQDIRNQLARYFLSQKPNDQASKK